MLDFTFLATRFGHFTCRLVLPFIQLACKLFNLPVNRSACLLPFGLLVKHFIKACQPVYKLADRFVNWQPIVYQSSL